MRGEIPFQSKEDAHICVSNGDLINVQVGDFFAYQPSELFDAFYDRAALVAIAPDLRERYVQHLSRMMKPQSKGLLVSLEILDESHQGPPFSVRKETVNRLFSQYWDLEVLKNVSLTDKKREVVYQMIRR